MTVGDSLNQSFNQDDAEAQRSVHAKQDKQAEGLEAKKIKEKFKPSHGQIMTGDDTFQSSKNPTSSHPANRVGPKGTDPTEGLKTKKSLDLEKIQHIKVGSTVSYTKGSGTIVKKDGAYVTIFNEAANSYDQVHAGETYIPGDTISMGIMNQLWDQMTQETRTSLLHKSKIQKPLHFVSRSWREIPLNLQDVIKQTAKERADAYMAKVPKGPSPPTTLYGSKNPNKPSDDKPENATRRPGTGPKSLGNNTTLGDVSGSGQTKITRPTHVFREVHGKKVSMTERQAANYDKKLEEAKRQGVTQPGKTIVNPKPTGTTETTTPKDTPKTTTPKTTTPKERAEAYMAKVPKGPSPSTTLYGSSNPNRPSADNKTNATPKTTTPKDTPKEDPGASAQGLSKATIEIYKLRNLLNIMKVKQESSKKDIDAKTLKSDVEHGLPGGVVSTDMPFDAKEDYEEDERTGKRRQLQHERYEPSRPAPTVVYAGDKKLKGDGSKPKTPRFGSSEGTTAGRAEQNRQWQEHGAGITENFDDKNSPIQTDDETGVLKTEELGGKENPFDRRLLPKGEGGVMSTSAEGTNNPAYDKEIEKAFRNEHNTRYGPRQISAEEVKKIKEKFKPKSNDIIMTMNVMKLDLMKDGIKGGGKNTPATLDDFDNDTTFATDRADTRIADYLDDYKGDDEPTGTTMDKLNEAGEDTPWRDPKHGEKFMNAPNMTKKQPIPPATGTSGNYTHNKLSTPKTGKSPRFG